MQKLDIVKVVVAAATGSALEAVGRSEVDRGIASKQARRSLDLVQKWFHFASRPLGAFKFVSFATTNEYSPPP